MDACKDDLDQCRTSSWYHQFRKVTPMTKIIKLPKEFIEYLMADGIILPRSSYSKQPLYRRSSSDFDLESLDQLSSESTDEQNHPDFSELENEIIEAIEHLGGSVFPKLTWSSPKDSAWLSGTSNLKCGTPGEIFILLKGSDFVMHDITSAYSDCTGLGVGEQAPPLTDHELVLRRWFDVEESMEFRVFISNRKIISISQRDTRTYYSFLPQLVEKHRDMITKFYEDNFTDYVLSSVVIDIYISPKTERMWLLDINPFTRTTDSLLFTWDEILEASNAAQSNGNVVPMFRVVRSRAEVAHRVEAPYSTNRYPREYVHVSSANSAVEDIASRAYYDQRDEDSKSNGLSSSQN